MINIPENFTRDLLRGDRPAILVEADASDPAATGNALGSLGNVINTALQQDLKGPLASLNATAGPVDVRIHALYNPEIVTQYNIVPGLMGVILTMTMIMITGLAITRERERGTMENLLSMPTRPSEVLIGKIVPYIMVGYIQVGVILVAAHFLFHVPMEGSILLLLAVALVFIAANLAMGITFSTIAKNQLQAMQMTFFVFLPSILLSGFMFPFRGMPRWAQAVGEFFPLTHFLRIVRGILAERKRLQRCHPATLADRAFRRSSPSSSGSSATGRRWIDPRRLGSQCAVNYNPTRYPFSHAIASISVNPGTGRGMACLV